MQFPDDVAARIAELFPTSRSFKPGDEARVRFEEWDVIVLRLGGFQHLPPHIYAIGFGTDGLGEPDRETPGFPQYVDLGDETFAQDSRSDWTSTRTCTPSSSET